MSDLPAPLTDHQKREIVRLRSAGSQHKQIARILGCTLAQSKHVWLLFTETAYAAKHRAAVLQTSKINRGLRAIAAGRKLRDDLTQKERMEIASRALRREIEEAKAERATAPIFRITAAEWVKA